MPTGEDVARELDMSPTEVLRVVRASYEGIPRLEAEERDGVALVRAIDGPSRRYYYHPDPATAEPTGDHT